MPSSAANKKSVSGFPFRVEGFQRETGNPKRETISTLVDSAHQIRKLKEM
jgi:hypothetical protein